jgi:hypothetical protein
VAERVGFELTGDFCSRSVRHMNTSNRRCQQDIIDISWKPFVKRFVSFAIPKTAMRRSANENHAPRATAAVRSSFAR